MCNKIHHDAKKLEGSETSGIGYKIFSYYPSIRVSEANIKSLVSYSRYTRSGPYKKIIWTSAYDKHGYGFCFFFSREEAERAKKDWIGTTDNSGELTIVRPIKFKDAMCKQFEDAFIPGKIYEVGICKEFEPILNEGEYI